ncbi:MAG: hypothetical protein K2J08_03640, partial [Ruminococcus sp.]|nr:hypothetical protein [Ruminococcus sp.]
MTWLVLAYIVIFSPIAFLAGLIKIIVKIIRKNKEKPKREKPSFSAVMFIVGTLLVMFSGVAFGVAGWVKTTPCGRVG